MLDIPLLTYFAFWYLGNYYYNIQNKNAANEAEDTKYALTLSVVQLAVGVIYCVFLWAAPDARKLPTMTFDDYVKMIPSGFLMAGAHASSVFSLAAGGVAFAQIVKAAEPAFTAVVSCFVYGKELSTARWFCLIPIIVGVSLAALKIDSNGNVDLDFTWGGLIGASLANLFAAFKSNEIKRVMGTPGIKDRIGSTGNQFAVQTIIAFFMLIPLMFMREYSLLGEFANLFKTNSKMSTNLVYSGLTFYIYNELATMTLTKISAVTQSVANTAKRVVVIVGCAIVFKESISGLKAIGCFVCIAGVFIDSVIDEFLKYLSSSDSKNASSTTLSVAAQSTPVKDTAVPTSAKKRTPILKKPPAAGDASDDEGVVKRRRSSKSRTLSDSEGEHVQEKAQKKTRKISRKKVET
jgi:solute carrier family 35 protein E1